MEANSKFDRRKLAGADLAKFVEDDSAGKRSVIIELAGDTPQVQFAESAAEGGSPRPFSALPIDEESVREHMDRLERQLTKLVDHKPVRLDVAQAFVVELAPEQLRAVTLLEEVGLVRPNRTHRVG